MRYPVGYGLNGLKGLNGLNDLNGLNELLSLREGFKNKKKSREFSLRGGGLTPIPYLFYF